MATSSNQMMDIKSLKKQKTTTQPYTKSLKVKILKVTTDWTPYTRSNGKNSKFLKFQAADHSDVCKAVGYDFATQEKILKEGASIFVKNYTFVQDTLKLLSNTKIYRCEPVVVPEAVSKSSSTTTVTNAAEVQNSPSKTLVTLEGTIIKEEAEKMVDFGNRKSKVKELTLKDESGNVKVSLWGDGRPNLEMKCGDTVRIEDGVVKYSKFYGENTVSLNSMALITPIEIKSENPNSKIIAITMASESSMAVVVQLDDELDHEYTCGIETICNYLNVDEECTTEDLLNNITCLLPIHCTIFSKGTTITKIEKE